MVLSVQKLNLDDLMNRLKSLEEKMNEMNDRFSQLPTPEEFSQFVTWPGLEDALRGIRTDFEGLTQPQERVVIEMSSQTEPVRTKQFFSIEYSSVKSIKFVHIL
ncbi:hypothetical protein KUTeg_004632 [Tegillarca granosa]|uniref:Uncharacterized protein n=1 Tax=Tegillarca granosa TaxID=220873 RepID=A0ABQ9FQ30_TEGGR|nr:hypothetical protein KUTeg_004632 [Tegillarca granosa]